MEKLKRVKSKIDFQQVITSKHKNFSQCFVVFEKKREEYNYSRFGLTASKKLGGAVQRVKIRRQVRAMIDEITKDLSLPNNDYVIVVRQPYLQHTYQENLEELKNLFKKFGGMKRNETK